MSGPFAPINVSINGNENTIGDIGHRIVAGPRFEWTNNLVEGETDKAGYCTSYAGFRVSGAVAPQLSILVGGQIEVYSISYMQNGPIEAINSGVMSIHNDGKTSYRSNMVFGDYTVTVVTRGKPTPQILQLYWSFCGSV